MNKEIFSFDLNSLDEDERRLLLSASLVFFMLSFSIAHLFTKNMLWRLLGTDSNIVDMKKGGENQKVYDRHVQETIFATAIATRTGT